MRDNDRRQVKRKPRCDRHNLVAFALTTVEKVVESKSRTWCKDVRSPGNHRWTESMNGRKNSLVKRRDQRAKVVPESKKDLCLGLVGMGNLED